MDETRQDAKEIVVQTTTAAFLLYIGEAHRPGAGAFFNTPFAALG